LRRLILGTAGHIDHGKTALVRALTGIDTDRLPEEKRRGITIDLGFASLVLPSGTEIGIVDVPGHEAFVRNMLAGATGIDVALLVVAADESVMPQTREHLSIIELLGVRSAVVALTKADLVDDDWLELVADEVREALADGALAQAPLVPVSAKTGQGLPQLIRAIEAAAERAVARDAGDLFRLPVDRVFTVRGTGTVVTGTVWSGSVSRDQQLRILPADRTLRLRNLQAFGRDRESVTAGERAALALAGVNRTDVERGDTIVADEGWTAAPMLTVRMRALPASPRPLRSRQRIRFHLGTAEVLGRIVLLERNELAPGLEGWAQLRLERPVVARAGDRFVIRSYSPVTTVGGGAVVEPMARRRKAVAPDDARLLARILAPDPAESVAAAVASSGPRGIAVSRLPVSTPHSRQAIAGVIAAATDIREVESLLFPAHVAERCRTALLEAVRRHHDADPLSAGPALDEVRRAAPAGSPHALIEWAIRSLLAGGDLVAEASAVHAPGFEPRLSPEQAQAAGTIVNAFQQAGLAPPATTDLPAEVTGRRDLDRLLRFLERSGALVQLAPGQWIARSAVDAAARNAAQHLSGRQLGPTDFKDLFGVSRKYLIPLLEYFDRTGVTIRRGDFREITAHR
jgi:selenocysteine-specific elongation factor